MGMEPTPCWEMRCCNPNLGRFKPSESIKLYGTIHIHMYIYIWNHPSKCRELLQLLHHHGNLHQKKGWESQKWIRAKKRIKGLHRTNDQLQRWCMCPPSGFHYVLLTKKQWRLRITANGSGLWGAVSWEMCETEIGFRSHLEVLPLWRNLKVGFFDQDSKLEVTSKPTHPPGL